MLVARPDLVQDVCRRLKDGNVTVLSPPGGGRSTVLALAATAVRETGVAVREIACLPSDSTTSYLGLAGLLEQCQDYFGRLPDPQLATVEVVTRRRGGEVDTVALCMAVRQLAAGPGAVVVIDDAQWLDAASRQALTYARPTLLTSRRVDLPATEVDRGAAEILVPPLDPGQVAALLQARELPHRMSVRVHSGSGGNPGLALALAAPAADPDGRLPLPGSAIRLCRELIGTVSATVRRSLLLVALADRPTVGLLRRTGEPALAESIAIGVTAGLLVIGDDEVVQLRSGAVAATVISDAAPRERGVAHTLLAAAAFDMPGKVWHEAMPATGLDDRLAARVTSAAEAAAAGGHRRQAAQLRMRAAELTTLARADEAMRLLAESAVDAAAAGRGDLVRRALSRLESWSPPGAVVARARIAVVDAAGQALDDTAEMLSRVLIEARDHPELVSAAYLRLAIRANLRGDPGSAAEQARLAVEQARRISDPLPAAAALTMLARMQRLTGDPQAGQTLAEALAIAPAPEADLHNSPRFLAIRHAVFDDRLAEARSWLLGLLPHAEHTGMAEDLVDLLRSLSEIDLRQGKCAAAIQHALRAVGVAERAGISPGPGWFSAAMAMAAGGSPAEARRFAEQAVQVSIDERDQVYLARSLHARGLIELLTRDVGAACATLTQVRHLESGDPSQLRWHGDLVEALVATHRLDEAQHLLDEVRPIVRSRQLGGVGAALDRAEGLLLTEIGDTESGVGLLRHSTEVFAELGMPVEQGRSLIATSVAERRRRRRAAARAASVAAVDLLTSNGARNWADAASVAIGQPEPTATRLTASDQRIVTLLRRGASNREISATLFLSVKTVEAALTRIYRTFGVKSRTQLCTMPAAPDPPT